MSRHPFDEIGVDALRQSGWVKWAAYPDAIGAWIAELDFGTAPPVTAALHAAVDARVFGYLPKALLAELAHAFVAFARDRYRWTVAPDDVRPVADVAAGFATAIEHFSAPGTPVILPTPAYMPFLTIPPLLRRAVRQVPMIEVDERPAYDLQALDTAFADGGPGSMLLLCNPHNPIGRVLEPAEMLAVAEVVERHGGRVYSDEIHAPLAYSGHRHVPYASLSPATAGHTLTATSASKAWNLPGLKCAQVILSNDADREVWRRVALTAEHGTSTPGVVANVAAYAEGGPWLDDLLAYLDGNRRALADLVAEQLPGVIYRPPEGTYLAWLDLRRAGLPRLPGPYLLEHAKVALTDGSLCGEAGRGFARLNFGTPRPVLARAVSQIAGALKGLQS